MAFEGRYRETQRGGGFGEGSSPQPSDSGTSNATTLQELEQGLIKFQSCIDSIGTQFDSHDNRADIKKWRNEIKGKVTSIKTGLKEGKKSHTPQNKILMDRQTAQLETLITKFQSLLEKEKSLVKQNPHPSNSGSPESMSRNDEVISPTQNQAMSQVQRMGGLEEREREREELQQLETDILDLREIQQDMAQLVHEQGEGVNMIEKNVSKAAVRVEVGAKQTQTAVVLKRKNTRLKLIIAAILVAVVLAILVVIAILLGVFIPRGSGSN